MGMAAFAERARRELPATGETARKRTVPETSRGRGLTAQEAQVARLARDGLSNPEIGARLFISPRTVQYHLSKVFTKLGISSRGQLDRVLPADSGHRHAGLTSPKGASADATARGPPGDTDPTAPAGTCISSSGARLGTPRAPSCNRLDGTSGRIGPARWNIGPVG